MNSETICSKEIKEVYNRPVDLPKTVPLWVVVISSLLLGTSSFYILYSERTIKHRDDNLEAEISKLSMEIQELAKKAKLDESEKAIARKKVDQFIEQVRILQAKAKQ